VEDGHLLLEFEGVVYKMALSNIDKARLNPVF
jgi:ribosome maturation factor RimP